MYACVEALSLTHSIYPPECMWCLLFHTGLLSVSHAHSVTLTITRCTYHRCTRLCPRSIFYNQDVNMYLKINCLPYAPPRPSAIAEHCAAHSVPVRPVVEAVTNAYANMFS